MINTNDRPIETRCLSSLSKVFADMELYDPEYNKGSAFLNETFSFQIAFRTKERIKNINVSVDSPFNERISLRSVGLVPSEFPINHDHDEHIIRATPGLYPDPLYVIEESQGLTAFGNQWRSVWVTVSLHKGVPVGLNTIVINFDTQAGDRLGQEKFHLEVIPWELPRQRLIHTEWFHCDCLSNYYGVEMFSREHWKLIDKYVTTAVEHGINMILTPLFTPPLDTAVGGERPTAQLVHVEKIGENYHFGFDMLRRWVDLCRDKGMQYFEFSHLFTQWGAKHAPKIMGIDNGHYIRLFGWETEAAGNDYRSFLNQFLPELVVFIKKNGLETCSYFHVSDEPHLEHLEDYRSASTILEAHVGGFPRIDALSDYSFYEKGLVPTPIPATNRIDPFLEHEVPDLWTYYCCSQYKDVANRFFCFPSARIRIIGLQLYKYNIKGFLHWGYNFWNSQFSKRPVDPFCISDCEGSYPSGDAFLVYPGKDGPIESLRLEVLYEALQDIRALELLESYIGRARVLEILEEGLETPLTFGQYPRSMEWLLMKRQQINQLIKNHAAGLVSTYE
jgi:hypothetical protein